MLYIHREVFPKSNNHRQIRQCTEESRRKGQAGIVCAQFCNFISADTLQCQLQSVRRNHRNSTIVQTSRDARHVFCGRTHTIELEAPESVSNVSLRYSFNNGTTWQNAQLLNQKYQIPCEVPSEIAISIEAMDVYGNSFQYFSSPAAVCKNVRLEVPDRFFADAGEPTTIFGNRTTIEGKELKNLAIALSNDEETYVPPNEDGSFSFTFIAPNATKTYRVSSPSAGFYDSADAYFTLEISEPKVAIDQKFVSDERADVGSN